MYDKLSQYMNTSNVSKSDINRIKKLKFENLKQERMQKKKYGIIN